MTQKQERKIMAKKMAKKVAKIAMVEIRKIDNELYKTERFLRNLVLKYKYDKSGIVAELVNFLDS